MKKRIAYRLGLIAILSCALTLAGCGDKSKSTQQKRQRIVTAQMKSTVTRLYYKGTLKPLKTIPVLSPVQGTVTALKFKYGEAVKSGQELAVLSSSKLASDYRQAVSKYFEAKDTYETSLQNYQGAEALHKAGVISTDSYTTTKSQFETNALNFSQAQFNLKKVLAKAGISSNTIERLSIKDTKEVSKILQRKFNHISIKAKGSGVALFPTQSQESSDDSNGGKLIVGSTVKEGQLILSIGDLTGFSATLQVSEININRMKSGLKVIVTGDAFPGITLHGSVVGVAKQANPSQAGIGGALSLFNIQVNIPKLTEAERKIIHVGMTAHFEIDIKNPPTILLPINAVFQKDGQNYVTVIDPKTKKTKDVPVITGTTTLTDVKIVSGLKPGDKVIVHD